MIYVTLILLSLKWCMSYNIFHYTTEDNVEMRYVIKHVELDEYEKNNHAFKICDSNGNDFKYFSVETEFVLPKNSSFTNKVVKHETQQAKKDMKIKIKTWHLGSVKDTRIYVDHLLYKNEKYQIFIIQDKELMAITHLTQLNLCEDEIEIVQHNLQEIFYPNLYTIEKRKKQTYLQTTEYDVNDVIILRKENMYEMLVKDKSEFVFVLHNNENSKRIEFSCVSTNVNIISDEPSMILLFVCLTGICVTYILYIAIVIYKYVIKPYNHKCFVV